MGGVCLAWAAPPLLTINYESVAEEDGDAALASAHASMVIAGPRARDSVAVAVHSFEVAPAGSAAGAVYVGGEGGSASANMVALPPDPRHGRMSGVPLARSEFSIAGSAAALDSTTRRRMSGSARARSEWVSAGSAADPDREDTRPPLGVGSISPLVRREFWPAALSGERGEAAAGVAVGAAQAAAAVVPSSLVCRDLGGSSPEEVPLASDAPRPDEHAAEEGGCTSEQSPSTATCDITSSPAFDQAGAEGKPSARIDDGKGVTDGAPRSRADPQASSLTGTTLTWALVHRFTSPEDEAAERPSRGAWRVRLFAILCVAAACGSVPVTPQLRDDASPGARDRHVGGGARDARGADSAGSPPVEAAAPARARAAATTARAAVGNSEVGEPDGLGECPRVLCSDGAPSLCSDIEPSWEPVAGEPISARPAAAQAVGVGAPAGAVACGECALDAPPSSSSGEGGERADAGPAGEGGAIVRRRRKRGERSLLTRTAWARWLQNWWRRVLWMRAAVGKSGAPWLPGDWRRCSPWRRLRTHSRGASGVRG